LINSETNHPTKNTPNKNNNNYINEDERNILLGLTLLPQEQESGDNHLIEDDIQIDNTSTTNASTSFSFHQIWDLILDYLSLFMKSTNDLKIRCHELSMISCSCH